MSSSQRLSKTLKDLVSATAFAVPPPQFQLLLYQSADAKCLPTTKQLHAHAITAGFLSNHLLSILTSTYARCGHVLYACKLFDGLPRRSLFSYRAMIQMYAENGSPRNALKLFAEMYLLALHVPGKLTYPFVFRACSDLLLLELGVVIHGLMVTSGVELVGFVGNSLLAMYMNCGDIGGAKAVFGAMKERSTVSWNTMISGYFRNNNPREALLTFRKMMEIGVDMDSVTILSVLPACGYLKDFEMGKEVHLLAEEKGLGNRLVVKNALLDMYVKSGRMDEACEVFDVMETRNVVTWTTMINGYVANGQMSRAIALCNIMQLEGVVPNEVTLASLLASCADLGDLKLGKCLHGWAIRHELECDVNVETALIDFYSSCKSIRHSFSVFSSNSRKRTVPWNAVLSGCILNGLAREAVELFKQMLLEAVKPNKATWKSLLPAYATLVDLKQATNIHGHLITSGFISNNDISTCLVGVYSKCGSLEYGHKLFDEIPMKDKDIFSWSSLIAGYGMHGHGEVACSLFKQMVQSGVKPNEITFTSVLHACSHAGLVDDGLNLFNFMHKNHQECLHNNHYTCMVDLLGRADRLEVAYELVKSMPFEPNHAVWGALLGGCVIHENVELGEVAARRLFELEPENTGNYVLLGKIYSAVGRWKDAEEVRSLMNDIGLVKAPAQSVV